MERRAVAITPQMGSPRCLDDLSRGEIMETMQVVFVIASFFVLVKSQSCPAGWTAHNNSCYFLHYHDKYDWVESKGFCDGHNAHLAYVESEDENNFIKKMIDDRFDDDDDAHVWLGATDEIQEGVFVWYKIEQPVKYTDWGPAEPNSNDLNEIEDCLVMWSAYRWEWADLNCDERAYFVCEKGASINPVVG